MTPNQLFITSLIGQLLAATLLYRQGSATHTLINSRLTALIEVTAKSERAKGVIEGRELGNREIAGRAQSRKQKRRRK